MALVIYILMGINALSTLTKLRWLTYVLPLQLYPKVVLNVVILMQLCYELQKVELQLRFELQKVELQLRYELQQLVQPTATARLCSSNPNLYVAMI